MNSRVYYCGRILAAALILSLVPMACGTNIQSVVTNIETGPIQTVDIRVPLPEESSTSVELNLEFIVGDLKLSPGASDHLASGTATFNAVDFEPKITVNGTATTVSQGKLKVGDIPVFQDDFKNQWDLQLANTPMSLNINTGPYSGNLELGGLSLQKLVISEVGSSVNIAFSTLNQVEMSSFTYNTGGSTMVLKGLANANFEEMKFNAGAGDYTLSFDGELQRDASVTIDAGVSTVNIIVPSGTNAKVSFDGGLSSVNPEGGWAQVGDVYTLSGSGPTITITVKMGVGTLNLKTE